MYDNRMVEDGEVEQFLASRKEAGLKIDPDTAEVHWTYRQVLDPYGVHQLLPEEEDCVGRTYFAKSPESGIWVWFGDLPDATQEALWEGLKSGQISMDVDDELFC